MKKNNKNKINDDELDYVCIWLLKNTQSNSKIMQPTKYGLGLVVQVHSKVVRAIKMYAKLYLKKIKHEMKILKEENKKLKKELELKENKIMELIEEKDKLFSKYMTASKIILERNIKKTKKNM